MILNYDNDLDSLDFHHFFRFVHKEKKKKNINIIMNKVKKKKQAN